MYVCGIDFGTTNSALGVCSEKTLPEMILLEDENTLIPSALFFHEDGRFFMGKRAVEMYVSREEGRFMRSLKRILGTELMNFYTSVCGRSISFEEIISRFLYNLKERAERTVGERIFKAVMGRPVHFQDNPLQDKPAEEKLLKIAHDIGFEEVLFYYEPIAAAFAHETKIEEEQLACVVDLGGGTSDFTVIRIGGKLRFKKERKEDILSTGGIRVGGNDFDRSLSLSSFMPTFGRGGFYGKQGLPVPSFLFSELSEWSMINRCYTTQNKELVIRIMNEAEEPEKLDRLLCLLEEEAAHLLLKTVEESKISLSSHEKSHSVFDGIREHLEFEVFQGTFESSSADHLHRLQKCLDSVVLEAGVNKSDIKTVILTGGTSQIPMIQKWIKGCFPNADFSEGAKMESVGLGLTYAAQNSFLR